MTSNTFTNTRTYADIDHYWNGDEYYLEAHEENGAWETIDRDQAVSEDGAAIYVEYCRRHRSLRADLVKNGKQPRSDQSGALPFRKGNL